MNEHAKVNVSEFAELSRNELERIQGGIRFSDLLVSSYQTGGSAGGDVVPVDQISLNYSKIEFEYKPQR